MVSLKATHLITLLSAVSLTSILSTVAGMPVDSDAKIKARDDPEVCAIGYWSDVNYGGDYNWQDAPIGQCVNVPSNWNDRISSTKLYGCEAYYTQCYFYTDYDCKGHEYKNDGDSNLRDGNGAMNDVISSFKCKNKKCMWDMCT